MSSLSVKHLPELIQKGIIDHHTAEQIEQYLNNKPKSYGRLLAVFAVLGALLIGLGIILIVAHNWDNLSRNLKTILSFIPLVIGQGFVTYTFLKKRGAVAWIEGSSTFLYLAIGGCISMISQIYHIQGNMDDFILLWTLLGLPLVYILRSSMASILFIVGLVSFTLSTGDYSSANYKQYLFWPLFALVIPHYIGLFKDKSSNFLTFLNWIIPIGLCLVIGHLRESTKMIQFLNFLFLFTIFDLTGRGKSFLNMNLARNGFKVIGTLGIITVMFMLSFEDIWENLIEAFSKSDMSSMSEFHGFGILFLSAIGLLAWKLTRGKKLVGILPYGFILVLALLTLGKGAYLILNLPLLLMSVYFIWTGSKNSKLRTLNLGILSLSTLIICRFFDLDIDYVTRGIVFVILGAGFFAINLIMIRKKKQEVIEQQ
ncbi:MAG: DUF2157 domain-containing protein [Flavobacteriales bacterium]|nr:DUF2157 domain-containing protein [Flavobacteriales bacterium]